MADDSAFFFEQPELLLEKKQLDTTDSNKKKKKKKKKKISRDHGLRFVSDFAIGILKKWHEQHHGEETKKTGMTPAYLMEQVRMQIHHHQQQQQQKKEEEKDYDHQIQRRVYDVLGALEGLGIISRCAYINNPKPSHSTAHHYIVWQGIPPVFKACEPLTQLAELQRQLQQIQFRIREKTRLLEQQAVQIVCLRNLAIENELKQRQRQQPPQQQQEEEKRRLELDDVVLTTKSSTKIHAQISPDRKTVLFELDDQFEVYPVREWLPKCSRLARVHRWDLPRFLPIELTPFFPPHLLLPGHSVPIPVPVQQQQQQEQLDPSYFPNPITSSFSWPMESS